MSDLTKENMINAILSAVKFISKRKIDPLGKGAAVKKLEMGRPVSLQKIKQLYEWLPPLPKVESLPMLEVETHLPEVEKLRAENLELKQKLARLKPEKSRERKVLGFRLYYKEVGAAGKRYRKLYASRRIKGKQVWIYIGKKSHARKKIRAWLEKQ